MKLALLSDLHEFTPHITDVDMVVFCGDHSFQARADLRGERQLWVHKMGPYINSIRRRGIVTVSIQGNHDFLSDSYVDRSLIADNFDHYYVDGFAEIEGFNFLFYSYCNLEDWAAFLPPDRQEARVKRLAIASSVHEIDFLITHCPPYGYLDGNFVSYGSPYVKDLLFDVKPRHLHAFGHIHECRGIAHVQGLKLINCAYTNRDYAPVCEYFVYDTDTGIITFRETTNV